MTEFRPSKILPHSSKQRRGYERDNDNQRATALVLSAMVSVTARAGKLTCHSLGPT